ncbi:MAG TPA: DnaA/Hda family protein [Thermoanaerobaculia bacterium]|nr:DnaA/Hda family protein [Thermoanaerobaculia bacterium]
MPECQACSGRGWLVEPGDGAGIARRCPCAAGRPLRDRLAQAGVWERYLHCTRETWRGRWPAARLAPFGTALHLCTIFGPVGAGKTHLATAILGEWLAGGRRGLWREFSSTLEAIKLTLATGGAESLTDALKLPYHLLVLDDLLAERGTDWTQSLLSHVLRYRHGRNLPTVLTANVPDLTELDKLEPRLSSRCGEGIVIGLSGPDRRTAERPDA